MKKIMIGLTVVGSMALAGCSDKDQPLAENSVGNNVGITQTRAVYAPGDGNIPVPNDLIFAGTENLTLNPPVADPTDFSDPLVAVSSLDGWSATAPFAFSFSNLNPTIDLDPSSVVPGSTIKMYEVSTLRPEVLPGTGIVAPTGPVTNVIRELTAPNDFVATYAGPMTVAILPTRPLTQQAGYMVVVTKGVRDTNGNAVMADAQYRIAQAPDPLPVGTPVEALEPVRQLVNAMENAAEAAGQPKADIVMSFQFTVQSVGDVVATAKLVYVDMPLLMGQTPATSFTSLGIDTSAIGLFGAADLYKGEFTLPYYLTAPDSLGNLRHFGVANPLSVLTDFIHGAANIPDGQGGSFPNPFAGDVTTYANKLPQVTGMETVPLMLSMPKAALCAKPTNGYPITIFQHGITSNRTTMVALADSMAAPPVCTAVVAMDLPIHGIDSNNALNLALGGALFEGYASGGLRERTFGVDYVDNTTGAPGPDGNPDASGAHTMNLQYLLVARDNTRQAILDLLALEKAIPFMDVDGDAAPDFDVNNIKFVGHSLGGIVGTGFIGNSDYVESAVLANPSSGLALMLDASPAFSPLIHAALTAAGAPPGSAAYNEFMFATQTVIDDGDPASTSAMAVVNGVPTLVLQNGNDQVIPNYVATAPQSGTTPHAAYLGTVPVSVTAAGPVTGDRLFSRFIDGGHSSILDPTENAAVTAEMQGQIASFLSSPAGAKAVLVSDPSLLVQ